ALSIAPPWLKLISPPPENEGEILVVEFIYRDSLSFSSRGASSSFSEVPNFSSSHVFGEYFQRSLFT
ncbi:MAG: hypothetical protein ACFNXW_06555, partial [Rothia dentocariosa]